MDNNLECYKSRIEELEDELDALNMKYLSQISLWKSRYEELVKTISPRDIVSEAIKYSLEHIAQDVPEGVIMRAFEDGAEWYKHKVEDIEEKQIIHKNVSRFV